MIITENHKTEYRLRRVVLQRSVVARLTVKKGFGGSESMYRVVLSLSLS